MKVKELIEQLQKVDDEKEIKAKYYYHGTDNDRYTIDSIEDKDKAYLIIHWSNEE